MRTTKLGNYLVELLEWRCFYSGSTITTDIDGHVTIDDDNALNGNASSANVTASFTGSHISGTSYYDAANSTVTCTFSGLPKHSMVQLVSFDRGADFMLDPQYAGDADTFTVTTGSKTFSKTVTGDYWDDQDGWHYSETTSGTPFGRWIAQDGDSLTISVTTNGLETGPYEDTAWIYGMQIKTYQPTVTIRTAKDEVEEGSDPFDLTIERSMPVGYAGPSSGDDAVPSLSVTLKTPTGSATEGEDYDAIAHSVTIPAGNSSATTPFKVKNDLKPEGYNETTDQVDGETVLLRVQSDATHYDIVDGMFPNFANIHIVDDLHLLSYDDIRNNSAVSAAITAAWNNSNADGPGSGKVEQGFGVYYSLRTGDLSVIPVERPAGTPPNRSPAASAEDPDDPAKVLVAYFHTHPFVPTDGMGFDQFPSDQDIQNVDSEGILGFLKNHSDGVISFGSHKDGVNVLG